MVRKFILYNGTIGNKKQYMATQAIKDVTNIAQKNGYQGLKRISFGVKGVSSLFDCLLALKILFLPRRAVVIYQNPMHFSKIIHKIIFSIIEFRKIRLICFIHDLNMFRGNKDVALDENKILKYSSVVITHNKEMTKKLIEIGHDASKIIELEIFDYLVEKTSECRQNPISNKSLVVAGNLSSQKCGYLYKLIDNSNIEIDLYGINLSAENLGDNVRYHGAFPAEILPHILAGGFGLVWDGNSIHSCEGTYGEYLKINNPHKVSLYIASGIPIIIWNKAAMAEFVTKNQIGLVVNKLDNIQEVISNITSKEYEQMVNNALVISKKIRNGFYTQRAIKLAEELLKVGS